MTLPAASAASVTKLAPSAILHLVARDDYLAVRGRQERLLPAMDTRVAGVVGVGEDVPVVQPDEIEREPLVVRDEMVALKRTATSLQHEPLPLERRGDLRDGGGASDEGATEIECQHERCCHHDEGGTGVGPLRGEERCRYSDCADPGQREDQGRHLRRPRKHRQARGRGRHPEARTPHRLEQLRPTVAPTESAKRPRIQTPLPRQPSAAHDRPTAPEKQHDRQRLVAVEADDTQREQAHEAQQREQGRDDRVAVDPHLPNVQWGRSSGHLAREHRWARAGRMLVAIALANRTARLDR